MKPRDLSAERHDERDPDIVHQNWCMQ